jgi:hypothetical protein
MRRPPRIAGPDRARPAILLLLALALAGRLVAGPAFAHPAMPGLVPICAGGEIVLVALGDEAPGAPAPSPEPCPWMGLGPVLSTAEQPRLPVIRLLPRIARPAPLPLPAPRRSARAHRARAPPAAVWGRAPATTD